MRCKVISMEEYKARKKKDWVYRIKKLVKKFLYWG